MLAADKFKIERSKRHGVIVYMLHGIIDEDAKFEILKKSEGPLIVNFRDVTAIDSCGIRSWVQFLKTISGRELSFEECPPLIVRQMNMVPSFKGHAQINSVFVSYVCDKCDHERLVLLSNDNMKVPNHESRPCDACGKGTLEFDGDPKLYFSFAA